jgi:hypothetical protein
MPDLIRLYINNVLIGFVISAFVVAGLLWFNIANLGHLVATSDVGLMAALLLWLFNGILFAGVQFAIAVMSMSDDDDDDDDGGHPAWDAVLIPVRNDRR